MNGKKIAVAMSGGVDSTVAACLLREEGYTVEGVIMRLLPDEVDGGQFESVMLPGLRRVCAQLDIPLHVLDLRREFRESVLLPSWTLYADGLTPNPCAYCNARLKFGKLLEYAKSIGAEALATGHYAQIEQDGAGLFFLRRGADRMKDQTYFLLGLTQEQLAFMKMPLGTWAKPDVRAYARAHQLPVAEKPESQDTCFKRDGEIFSETLRRTFDGVRRTGFFKDGHGKRLGTHEGFHLYTLGQRKGLRVAMGKPAYIVAMDPRNADIFLSTDESDLDDAALTLESISFHAGVPPVFPLRCAVQVRYRSPAVECTLTQARDGLFRAVFDAPQRAVTPGQGAAFYLGDRMLGGGWIHTVEKAHAESET